MNIKYMLILLIAAAGLVSCSSDDVDSNNSIFDTASIPQTEFDNWLKKNYTDTYNIQFNYLYNDKLSDNSYNVVPATLSNSKAMAILMKHVWMDAYTEVAGNEFLKTHCFRQMQLIGSAEYDGQSSIVLGTAEGGLKVLLFRINELDPEDIYVNQDDPYRGHSELPLDLNFWYFHTMHHEFCHILTQTKNYTTDFQTISSGKYHSSDWVNVADEEAPKEGFVTGYASGEYNEDFAETYATYVTYSEEGWKKILLHGIDTLSCDTIYKDGVDEEGNKAYLTDDNGYLIPKKDANGNIIYQKDASGNYVYFMLNGGKVPMYNIQSRSLVYTLQDGEPYIQWKNGSTLLPLTKHPGQTPLYQTTDDGQTVYDASGKPIPAYYKLPEFECKQVISSFENVVVDTTGRDAILQKLDIVKSYLKESWNVDLEELRSVVLRRSREASSLDLNTLK